MLGEQGKSIKGGAGATVSSAEMKVFAVNYDDVVPSRKEGDLTTDFGKPWIMEERCAVARKTLEGPAVRLNLVVYRAQFCKQTERKREFKPILKCEEARRDLMTLAPPAASLVMESHPTVNAIHVFGFAPGMVHIGPDVNSAGSLRITADKSGDRVVVAADFAAFQSAVSADLGESFVATMPQCQAAFKQMDQDHYDKFRTKHNVVFYRSIVREGSVLYMPPGMIFAEKVLNKHVVGINVPMFFVSSIALANLRALRQLVAGLQPTGSQGDAVKFLDDVVKATEMHSASRALLDGVADDEQANIVPQPAAEQHRKAEEERQAAAQQKAEEERKAAEKQKAAEEQKAANLQNVAPNPAKQRKKNA